MVLFVVVGHHWRCSNSCWKRNLFVLPPLRSGGGSGLMFPRFSQADAEALSESKSSTSTEWNVRLSAQQYGQSDD